jgi:hypothetical protein
MSAMMIFVMAGAALTLLAGIGWYIYSLFAGQSATVGQQLQAKKIANQAWDDKTKAGARGIR